MIAVALAAVAIALLLDMSGEAPRGAGSDHASNALFAAVVPGGGTLCQPDAFLSPDAARVRIQVGTFGQQVPAIGITFFGAANDVVASGRWPGGGPEGFVTIPLSRSGPTPASSRACLNVGGHSKVALAGEAGPVIPSSEIVNGHQQAGRVSLSYFRRGEESWWSLLPELARRFGLGKSPLFGSWTLPLAALLLLSVWVAALRLLVRGQQ